MPRKKPNNTPTVEYELVARNVSDGTGTHILVPVSNQKLQGRAAKKSTTTNRGQASHLFGQPVRQRSGYVAVTDATQEEHDEVFGDADEVDFDEDWIQEMMAPAVDGEPDYIGPAPEDGEEAFPTHETSGPDLDFPSTSGASAAVEAAKRATGDGVVRAAGRGGGRPAMRATADEVDALLKEYRTVGIMDDDDPRAMGAAPLAALRPALVEFTSDVVHGAYPKLKRSWGVKEIADAIRPSRLEGIMDDLQQVAEAAAEEEEAAARKAALRKFAAPPRRPARPAAKAKANAADDESSGWEDDDDDDGGSDDEDEEAQQPPAKAPPKSAAKAAIKGGSAAAPAAAAAKKPSHGASAAADHDDDGDEEEDDDDDWGDDDGEDPFAEMLAQMDKFKAEQKKKVAPKAEPTPLPRLGGATIVKPKAGAHSALDAAAVNASAVGGMLRGAELLGVRERAERTVAFAAAAANRLAAIGEGMNPDDAEAGGNDLDVPGQYVMLTRTHHENVVTHLLATEAENAQRTIALVHRQEREAALGIEPTQVLTYTERKPLVDAVTQASRRTVGVNIPTTIAPPPRARLPPRMVTLSRKTGAPAVGKGITKGALAALQEECGKATVDERVDATVGAGMAQPTDGVAEAGAAAAARAEEDSDMEPVDLPDDGESEPEDPHDYLGGETWIGRRRDETAEEKKARKAGVKEENRLRRMQKAALRDAYKQSR